MINQQCVHIFRRRVACTERSTGPHPLTPLTPRKRRSTRKCFITWIPGSTEHPLTYNWSATPMTPLPVLSIPSRAYHLTTVITLHWTVAITPRAANHITGNIAANLKVVVIVPRPQTYTLVPWDPTWTWIYRPITVVKTVSMNRSIQWNHSAVNTPPIWWHLPAFQRTMTMHSRRVMITSTIPIGSFQRRQRILWFVELFSVCAMDTRSQATAQWM